MHATQTPTPAAMLTGRLAQQLWNVLDIALMSSAVFAVVATAAYPLLRPLKALPVSVHVALGGFLIGILAAVVRIVMFEPDWTALAYLNWLVAQPLETMGLVPFVLGGVTFSYILRPRQLRWPRFR